MIELFANIFVVHPRDTRASRASRSKQYFVLGFQYFRVSLTATTELCGDDISTIRIAMCVIRGVQSFDFFSFVETVYSLNRSIFTRNLRCYSILDFCSCDFGKYSIDWLWARLYEWFHDVGDGNVWFVWNTIVTRSCKKLINWIRTPHKIDSSYQKIQHFFRHKYFCQEWLLCHSIRSDSSGTVVTSNRISFCQTISIFLKFSISLFSGINW